MKRYELNLSSDPSFNTIVGLTNTTFNPTDYMENRMATEQQISELYNRIVENEIRRDKCCRDIIVWEAHVQIVRMNTLNIESSGSTSGALLGGGVVISDFDENISIGTMRRGLSYTVEFPVKWDNSLYVKRSAFARSSTQCTYHSGTPVGQYPFFVNYRLVEENSIDVANCQSTSTNYARFWYGLGGNITTGPNNNVMGHMINPDNNWGSFIYDVKDDGTVTITDHRRNTNFNIIRFYTQWILRRTADNQTIPDPE